MLPILKTGESIIVGEAVRMPMRAIITFPDKKNRPDSNDPIVASDEKGKGAWNNNLDITDDEFQNIIKAWRLQQINFIIFLKYMERQYVSSSNIASIGYDPDNQVLEIEFFKVAQFINIMMYHKVFMMD